MAMMFIASTLRRNDIQFSGDRRDHSEIRMSVLRISYEIGNESMLFVNPSPVVIDTLNLPSSAIATTSSLQRSKSQRDTHRVIGFSIIDSDLYDQFPFDERSFIFVHHHRDLHRIGIQQRSLYIFLQNRCTDFPFLNCRCHLLRHSTPMFLCRTSTFWICTNSSPLITTLELLTFTVFGIALHPLRAFILYVLPIDIHHLIHSLFLQYIRIRNTLQLREQHFIPRRWW